MKKIVMLFAAAMCFAAAQGASLNWTITNVKTPADSGVAGEGYTAYLFATSVGGALTYDTTTIEAVTAAINDGSFKGGIATGKTSSAGGIAGDTGLGNGFGAGDSLSGFAVIFDGDYDFAAGGNYIITPEKSASWTSPTGAKTLIYGTQATARWTSYGGTTPVTPVTPTPTIPEPTSGLLLLVGGAALALRRKQK